MNFTFQPSEDNDILHYAKGTQKKGAKYLSRKLVNGKWVYTYKKSTKNTRSTNIKVSKSNKMNNQSQNNKNDSTTKQQTSDIVSGIERLMEVNPNNSWISLVTGETGSGTDWRSNMNILLSEEAGIEAEKLTDEQILEIMKPVYKELKAKYK